MPKHNIKITRTGHDRREREKKRERDRNSAIDRWILNICELSSMSEDEKLDVVKSDEMIEQMRRVEMKLVVTP